MKISNFYLLLLKASALVVLIVGIPSCSKKDIDEPTCPQTEDFFDIEGINLTSYVLLHNNTAREVALGETIEVADFSIQCRFKNYFYSFNRTPSFNLFETQSANALTCKRNGFYGSKEGIDSIYIISTNPLSSQYNGNDTINNIVLIDGVPPTTFAAENSSVIENPYGFSVQLNTSVPNTQQPHSFTVILKLGNGEVYTATSNPVYFK